MAVVWGRGESDVASWGQSGLFQARKAPCRMADAECGLKAALCTPASKISEVDFPQGNWKGEYEVDFPQGFR